MFLVQLEVAFSGGVATESGGSKASFIGEIGKGRSPLDTSPVSSASVEEEESTVSDADEVRPPCRLAAYVGGGRRR